MQESSLNTQNTLKTGPIHQPRDGRPTLVEVRNLVKTFGQHEAVKNVSFTIGKGEIFGLLGPNGAGKSTTINMMCGYIEPTSGETIIDGLSINREPLKVKRIIGVVPQQIVSSVMSQLAAGSAAVSQVYRVCNQPGNRCTASTLNSAVISASVARASGIAAQRAVASLNAGQAPHIGTFDEILPGYAIFFALFSINAAAATILQEKEDGTFRRLLIAPVQKYALLGGKLLAQFLLTLIQLAILFGIGYLVFHIHIGNWPAVIALLIGASFAATGLGILLVSLVKSRRQLAPVVTLVTLITSAIGGAWWPLFIEPTWMQQIAKIGLTAWAMEGLNNVMLFGRGFSGALPDILGLFAYGLICLLIAMRFFRFQEKVA